MKHLPTIILSSLLLITSMSSSKAQSSDDAAVTEVMNSGKVLIEGEQVLPFEIWNDVILVKMTVNGVEGLFVWDNGFVVSALDVSVIEKAKLTPVELPSMNATDGTGQKVDLTIELAKRVTIGAITVADTPFTVIDFEKIIGPGVKPIGILGSSILKKLNWSFDFDKAEVTVSPDKFSAEGTKISYRYDAFNHWKILFGINGSTGYLDIDFGYNGDEVELPLSALPAFGGAQKATMTGFSGASVAGLANHEENYLIKDFAFTLGEEGASIPVKLAAHLTGSNFPKLGNRFFRHFNVIINAPAGEMILQDRAKPIDPLPEKNYGFAIGMHEGKAVIVSHTTNPNVIRNPELKLLDQVVSINGTSISEIRDLRGFQIDLRLNNHVMVIDMADGRAILLTPEADIYK